MAKRKLKQLYDQNETGILDTCLGQLQHPYIKPSHCQYGTDAASATRHMAVYAKQYLATSPWRTI